MTTTTFDPWLAMLAAGNKLVPVGALKLAVRGEAWNDLIAIAGDWTGGTLEGSIRTAPDAASVLAAITVGALDYDAVADVTTWPVSLASGTGSSPDSTGLLSPDSNGDGTEYFPVAFYLTPSGGEPKDLLFGTALPLIGKV